MGAAATVEDEFAGRSACWCCGIIDDPEKLVHLGNHPEVALCTRCARWAGKQADAVEDRSRTGLAVMVRDRARFMRRVVIQRGWHRLPLVGGALRRLGRYTP
jgi:hypothetical protein